MRSCLYKILLRSSETQETQVFTLPSNQEEAEQPENASGAEQQVLKSEAEPSDMQGSHQGLWLANIQEPSAL